MCKNEKQPHKSFMTDTNIPPKHVVLACQIAGIYDVNRNEILPYDDFNLIKEWADSLANHQIKGIVFHNSFSENTVNIHQNEFLEFIKIDYTPFFNPNVFRYSVYKNYLEAHSEELEALFVTDISDVVMVSNPFETELFKNNPDKIFCGDEPKVLHNDWMISHSSHLRKTMIGFEDYESTFKDDVLLNCGVIGGHIGIIKDFISKLWDIHEKHNQQNDTDYTGDMGAFNYLVRTQFNTNVIYGSPVTSVFKEYQTERTDCWFRHK